MIQLSLNIDIHKAENNPVSQAFLEAHRDDFTHDAWKVLLELLKGTRLTNNKVIQMGLSNSPTRRFSDLKEWGVNVSRQKIKVGYSNREVFEYWLEPEEIGRVANLILNKMIVKKAA